MSAVRKPDSSSLLIPPSFKLRRLGVRPYLETYETMRAHLGPDEVWLLEHPPVYTLGQAGHIDHLHSSTHMVGEILTADTADGPIPVIQSDRGGQVTYHGPGQAVAYLLLDLSRRNLKIRELVSVMEDVVISTLREFGVVGVRRPKAPGVYVGKEKIAQLGLRIRRGRSYHGLSLNVNMNLAPFGWIDPCGMEGLQVTQLSHFCPGVTTQQAFDVLASNLTERILPSMVSKFSNDSGS